MKYKTTGAIPEPRQGRSFAHCKVLTVPNEALSLKEIIERFTRGESLDVSFPVQYHESEDDIEKLSRMDIIDKKAYIAKMQETQDLYKQQEEARRLALEEKTRKQFYKELAEKEAQKAPAVDSTANAK